MNSVTHSKRTAIAVMNALFGLDFIVAGGGARDTHYGITPKDYDIVFPRGTTQAELKMIARNLQTRLGHPTDRPIQAFHFVHSDGSQVDNPNERVLSCVKVQVSGVDFDLLRYNVDTAAEAPQHFDFNLNQFQMNFEGETVFVGKPEEHPEDAGLLAIRGDHKYKREVYVRDKYADIFGRPSMTPWFSKAPEGDL